MKEFKEIKYLRIKSLIDRLIKTTEHYIIDKSIIPSSYNYSFRTYPYAFFRVERDCKEIVIFKTNIITHNLELSNNIEFLTDYIIEKFECDNYFVRIR